MAYTVLARKYRPQRFSDLVGQEAVTRTLTNAIASGRTAHAFLFTGARGVGKTTTARLLAKALNCEKGPTAEPCNECGPCTEITSGTDLDVLEIDGASHNSVDDVRRLQESLPYRPARDRTKIVIVDEVHMLSGGAFNALLKTLEEPPPHVTFIFATTEIHKVPITIRSRCQRYDFRLIPQVEIAERVREVLAAEGIEADDAGVTIVAREAAGSMRDALTVLDQLLAFGGDGLRGADVAKALGIADRTAVRELLGAVLAAEPAACVQTVAQLAEQGLDLLHLSRQLVLLARDLVVLKVVDADTSHVELTDSEREWAQARAQEHSGVELERVFAGLARLVDEIAQSSQAQLVLEMGLVRIADRPPLEPLSELLGKLDALLGTQSGGTSRGARSAAPAAEPRGPAQQPRMVRPRPARNEPAAEQTAKRAAPAAQPTPSPEPSAAKPSPPAKPTAPSKPAAPPDGAWGALLEALHTNQPALGAVLEHGVATEVSEARIHLVFPEGSFFGSQAASPAARDALADAAERLLGGRPSIDVTFGQADSGTSIADERAARERGERARTKKAALEHPSVREALEVFPEVAGSVRVEVDS